MAEMHYEASSRAYWSSFSARRVDGVREELEEAAASPNGFMSSAFKILRRTRPSACGNKARAPAPDLMSAIFEGGDDKDPSKLRTGADGFREELLKQGSELYAARPSCGAAVEALLGRLEPVLRRHVRGEAGEGAAPETEAAEVEMLVRELMSDARWRQLLGKARARLAVGGDGFPGYLLRQATAEVQGLFLDGLRDIVRTRDVPESWSDWPVILAPKPGKDRRLLRKRRDITLLPHAWALFMKLIQPGYSRPVEVARPWCQAGFEAFRTPPAQTLGLRAAMEQAMAMRSTIAIALSSTTKGSSTRSYAWCNGGARSTSVSRRGSLTSCLRCTRRGRRTSRRPWARLGRRLSAAATGRAARAARTGRCSR